MEMSGQLHAASRFTPGKGPPVPIRKEAGWAPDPAWTLWRTEKCFVPVGNRIPVVWCVHSCYTD
jgi:hypothetical protein